MGRRRRTGRAAAEGAFATAAGRISAATGAVCLLFALIPMAGYLIFNVGVAVLLTAGTVLVLLPHFCRHISKRMRRLILLFCCAALLPAAALSAAMVRTAWYSQPPAGSPADVIVLGSKIIGTRPSLMLERRLRAAVAYLKENPQALCVVSGGQGVDEICPEAQVMAEYLAECGVEPRRILQEPSSSNTLENIAFSAALLREKDAGGSVLIVTDGFHQLRAGIYARSEGLPAYHLSCSSPWGLLPSYWIREWFGICKAWADCL